MRIHDKYPDFKKIALAIAGGILALVLVFFSLRYLTKPLVSLLPRSVDQSLGQWLVEKSQFEKIDVADAQIRAELMNFARRIAPDSDMPFQFFVVRDAEANAHALPGGPVLIHCGILPLMESSHELGGVLAHEIAHVELRHGTQAMIGALGTSLLITAVLGDFSGLLGGVANFVDVFASKAYSRSVEQEADEYALAHLKRLGLRRDGLSTFFGRLSQKNHVDKHLKFLSTHPSHEDRATYLRAPSQGAAAFSPEFWTRLQKTCAPNEDKTLERSLGPVVPE